jgi:hypothetical protein
MSGTLEQLHCQCRSVIAAKKQIPSGNDKKKSKIAYTPIVELL